MKRWMPGILALGFVIAPALGLAQAAQPASQKSAPLVRRALVVATNESDDPTMPALRFADDDGFRWAETFARLGVETTLLVQADEKTRSQLSLARLTGTKTPTREALTEAVEDLRRRIAEDRAAGRQVDVFFVYVGHGNTDDAGRAYLTLQGARLDRAGLYAEIVQPLGADFVHLVIDACRASGVVGTRGAPDPSVLADLREVLKQEQPTGNSNVGALFAESDTGETHEWSRLRAGVFSHVARSGLMGGADINADGTVEYSELAAFVAASMEGVSGSASRMNVHAVPPTRDPRRALASQLPPGPVLRLPPNAPHVRVSVEDDGGLRLADVRRSLGEPLALALPPRAAYWVRTPEAEAKVSLAQMAKGSPLFARREVVERGPVADALRKGLFSVPFNRDFYKTYVSQRGFVPVPLSPFVGPVSESYERAAWYAPEWSSFGVGTLVSRAPAGQRGAFTGLSLSWRRRLGADEVLGGGPARWIGARATYGLTPVFRDFGRLHRGSIEALAGFNLLRGPLSPYGELSGGWTAVGRRYAQQTQGEPMGLTARAALGVHARSARIGGFSSVRTAFSVSFDGVRTDGRRRLAVLPGLELELGW